MTYYEAKFAREAKARPADWVITPVTGRPRLFRLVEVPKL